MLDVISKADYFSALDDPEVSEFLTTSTHDLKRVQDAYIFNLLKDSRNLKNLKILEVGGGNSRLLRSIHRSNELWNLDEFQGRDGGPSSVVNIDGVKTVIGRLGRFLEELPAGYFDIVFSVSVLEHVSSAQAISDFFRDGARVLRVGGAMHHAVDLYLQDNPLEYSSNRVDSYIRLAEQDGLRFQSPPTVDRKIQFQCCYATNPDLGMYGWNRAVPQLAALRNVSQSVSLKIALIKREYPAGAREIQ